MPSLTDGQRRDLAELVTLVRQRIQADYVASLDATLQAQVAELTARQHRAVAVLRGTVGDSWARSERALAILEGRV